MKKRPTIWTYWEDGEVAAPPIAQLCFRSWRALNSEYDFIVVDRNSIDQYTDGLKEIDLFRPDITVQKRSNLLRLALLDRHGGVWVDASVMCNAPLRDWLHEYQTAGFFAFRHEKKSRDISTWFMASEANNPLTHAYFSAYRRNFTETYYKNQNKKFYKVTIKTIGILLNRNCFLSQFWVHPAVRNTIKMYPYFHVHYTFNRVIRKDPLAREIWEKTKHLPRSLGRHVRVGIEKNTSQEELAAFVDNRKSPVHKLSWRTNYDSPGWQYILSKFYALISQFENDPQVQGVR
jgi:hypothetical protein